MWRVTEREKKINMKRQRKKMKRVRKLRNTREKEKDKFIEMI